ncbi:hypothetical protein TEA_009295 [Camellia sinensis var. sinensis]|uniref:DUF4378 domain-containing protein n=1 Tax=Camellia sinensis var. sinensis TaxID=542762 RepID=A0A4S4EVR5_CAMSN|nr:hypothetical protein TEA_009295 [Camellia sinensis var. sinensis]
MILRLSVSDLLQCVLLWMLQPILFIVEQSHHIFCNMGLLKCYNPLSSIGASRSLAITCLSLICWHLIIFLDIKIKRTLIFLFKLGQFAMNQNQDLKSCFLVAKSLRELPSLYILLWNPDHGFHEVSTKDTKDGRGSIQDQEEGTELGRYQVRKITSETILGVKHDAFFLNIKNCDDIAKFSRWFLAISFPISTLSLFSFVMHAPHEPQIEPSKEDPVPLRCPVPEPPSPGSSKDADHPSPVSVLEIPFTEEISSGSECFERVSADLQGLRMQLKLLKMESGAYTDEGMLMSSDKDDEIFEDDSFECSYLIDVLIDSGFEDADPDMIIATWHSPDCPLGPGVFDNLEKKYCNETWLRSERRLLFDLINTGLVEIFQWLINPHPWVKLLTRKVGPPEWQKHGLKYEVRDFLENEEKKAREEVTERLLDREMLWLDSGDGIDAIGKEIEKLLIDDLIAEVADM